MSLREKFAKLVEAAQKSVDYWRDVAVTDFVRDLNTLMLRRKISHSELAARMGTSRPYVTRLLSGGNFTLETMVKLAMALDGVIRVHIADRDAVTIWKDEIRGSIGTARIEDNGPIKRISVRSGSGNEPTARVLYG